MRAWEFLTEAKDGVIDAADRGQLNLVHDGLDVVSYSLPDTYIIPELKNNDYYDLYRFGVAIAAVRGESGQDDGVEHGRHRKPHFEAESAWGEHQIVSSTEPDIASLVDKALEKVGLSQKIRVSTVTSDEFPDTTHVSPINPFKGYPR